MNSPRHSQQGISLLVGLIMLVLITLLVVTSFNLTNTQLKIVNNAQVQIELEATANAALEQTVSSAAYLGQHGVTTTVNVTRFNPNLASPVSGGVAADVAVAVTPTCVRSTKLTAVQISNFRDALAARYEALMVQAAALPDGPEKVALLATANAVNANDEQWRSCNFGTEAVNPGGGLSEGGSSATSAGATICADTVWDIQAIATSQLDTAAQLETHLGVSSYADISKVPTACKPS